jgi:DNA-binding XRE family transcriptional regulator
VPAVAASTGQQAGARLAGAVAQLYFQRKSYLQIGNELGLTKRQVHKILSELFAEGMPHLSRREMSEETVRAIHAAYARGDTSINKIARAIGFTGDAARRRIIKLGLPLKRQTTSSPARSPAHAEQRVITGLLIAKVDELRKPRAISIEALAGTSGVSLWTIQQLRSELSDPRLTTVLRLCRGLGVTAGQLLDDIPLPVEARHRTPGRTTESSVRGTQ